MSSWSIYALKCPLGGEVRYIGATKSIERRYGQHCRVSENLGSTRRSNWLYGLIKQGLKPSIEVLESNLVCYNAAERRWIEHYRALGYELVNGNAGGFDLSHTHKSPKSNKSRGTRTRFAIHLQELNRFAIKCARSGDIDKALKHAENYLHIVAIIKNLKKRGLYDHFIGLYERRHGTNTQETTFDLLCDNQTIAKTP